MGMSAGDSPKDVDTNELGGKSTIDTLISATVNLEDAKTVRCKWNTCSSEIPVDDLLPHLATQHFVSRSQRDENLVCLWDHCETPQPGSSQVPDQCR